MIRPPPRSTLFPSTPLFRSWADLGPIPPYGVPGITQKLVRDADVVAATGIVEPHQYAGYSGWRKTVARSEEHTSELQSQSNLVCRLLLEKKKKRASDDQHLG